MNRYEMDWNGRLFAEHAGRQWTDDARGLRRKGYTPLLHVPGLQRFSEHKARLQLQAAMLQIAIRAFRSVQRHRSRGHVPDELATDV